MPDVELGKAAAPKTVQGSLDGFLPYIEGEPLRQET
jgi:hypothetical protein